MDHQVDTGTAATSTLNTKKNGNEYQKKIVWVQWVESY